jgi:pimeloyl-ACP methyl ester carboxylesterase
MSSNLETESGFAPSGDTQIYFETAGSGPALVFLHAGSSDLRMWDPQFDLFSRRFRVVRYDHRGLGKTRSTHTPFMLHEDLLSVMRYLGIARAALVGCSMGGIAAIDFTLAYPDMVDALILSGPGLSGWTWSPEIVKLLTEMFERVGGGDIDGARQLNERLWLEGPRDPRLIDPIYRSRASALSADNFRPERWTIQAQPPSPPSIERLSEIKAPTLIVIGDCDAPDLHKIANLLVTEIDGARLVTIPNAAHLPNLEHPDHFNRIVLDFLDAIPRPATKVHG